MKPHDIIPILLLCCCVTSGEEHPSIFTNIVEGILDFPSGLILFKYLARGVDDVVTSDEQAAGEIICDILAGDWQDAADLVNSIIASDISQDFPNVGNFIINIPHMIDSDFIDLVTAAEDVVDIVENVISDIKNGQPGDALTEIASVVTAIGNDIISDLESIWGDVTSRLACFFADKSGGSSTGLAGSVLSGSFAAVSSVSATAVAFPSSLHATSMSAKPIVSSSMPVLTSSSVHVFLATGATPKPAHTSSSVLMGQTSLLSSTLTMEYTPTSALPEQTTLLTSAEYRSMSALPEQTSFLSSTSTVEYTPTSSLLEQTSLLTTSSTLTYTTSSATSQQATSSIVPGGSGISQIAHISFWTGLALFMTATFAITL